ncbi:acetyl-CoA carboxylase biotin carboxylase subunit [Rubrobacter taiwanensis]|jgi:3-methylcrotonyl-CoA carboxylase alpha subunit|uniref:Biotin-dependent 3-methylcrotonyl-coenzyme A carboxylase alpha1 subunit n=1 Tax=Rubrobacter taiwanensis TaxID=185139 RepID=A0A4R1BGF0_9ACTN|nr:acetyl-CoA carboxylase biotin carboxylase subunit [Rubrobacter taiwanensis]TCJ16158.1 acetyl-CoA carboxylase biotin carboxylase subunit [Rubrobacter taiwanensis]
MFSRILIANRGEIAVRIIRACRELGIAAVAVYSEADAGALHVRLADESYLLGPAAPAESYLNIERILDAVRESGAEAVHPGYGFLAENADFARAVEEAGAVWIGPPPEAMELMGSKVAAKRLAEKADVPTVPGYTGDDTSVEKLAEEAGRIGFPVLIKASAGGGGRGMRAVRDPGEFPDAVESAQREALSAFGDGRVFLEKLIERPRHIEVQVLGDNHGNVVHLGERECSIQRRHQKIIEESPSPALTPEEREELGEAAVRLAEAAGYRNAGTVEFMLEGHRFYFLEMNTRLQVEHPVTELVTGRDLVELQIRVAAGERLPFAQESVELTGSAIEARVYAEDPETFMPTGGRILLFRPPEGPGIRNDAGVESGDEVPVNYDPMIGKLIVYAPDRPAAVSRMQEALRSYVIEGVVTNLPLLRRVAGHPAFAAGDTSTDFLETHGLVGRPGEAPAEALLAAAVEELSGSGNPARDPFELGIWRAGGAARIRYLDGGRERTVEAERNGARLWRLRLDGEEYEVGLLARTGNELHLKANGSPVAARVEREGSEVRVSCRGREHTLARPPALNLEDMESGSGESGRTSLEAPMPGIVIKVLVEEGEEVRAQQPLLVLEAMKMEQPIVAPYAGVVTRLPFREGSMVSGGAVLAELEELTPEA